MSASTTIRDKNTVTTILAIKNQLAANLGIGFEVDTSTTINTKRNVLKDMAPSTFPKIRYFGIGIKGYANLTADDNTAQAYNPSAENCDLYEPIPFRCVQERLSPAEADQYRICTTATINGKTYYQYWLKKIVFQSNVVKTTQVQDGIQSDYSVDAANLNPTPNDLYPTTLSDTEKRITASVVGICKVTGAEVLEVINAMYGGDLRRARISEIGTYSGCESSVVVNGVTYAEAAYVQLCTHKCTLGHTLSDEGASLTEMKVFENSACVVI